MLLIMVTVHASGAVSYVKELNAYTPIIDEFERVCKAYTGSGYVRARVTLWDTDTNLSHGSREVNKPEPVKVEAPTNEEIRTWISTNCEDELNANKKIQAIKKTRDAFYSEDPTGFRLGLRDAKDHVEAVIAEYEEKKRSSSYCDCD
jgi:ribosomal protein L7/L12